MIRGKGIRIDFLLKVAKSGSGLDCKPDIIILFSCLLREMVIFLQFLLKAFPSSVENGR